jgi:hypothetical protein
MPMLFDISFSLWGHDFWGWTCQMGSWLSRVCGDGGKQEHSPHARSVKWVTLVITHGIRESYVLFWSCHLSTLTTSLANMYLKYVYAMVFVVHFGNNETLECPAVCPVFHLLTSMSCGALHAAHPCSCFLLNKPSVGLCIVCILIMNLATLLLKFQKEEKTSSNPNKLAPYMWANVGGCVSVYFHAT